jgi:hypothetical protein
MGWSEIHREFKFGNLSGKMTTFKTRMGLDFNVAVTVKIACRRNSLRVVLIDGL